MKGLFIDANEETAAACARVRRPGDPIVDIHHSGHVTADALPGLCAGRYFVFNDHSFMPTEAMRACADLRHVIFLGTGARSYMHVEELASLGITVHIIKGYGDTAVAEHAIALMWAAARGIAVMDRAMRAGTWRLTGGMQLTGKTLGLIGYGGIGAEVARIAAGSGMRVHVWNRTPRAMPDGVQVVDLDTLLAESHVVSMHLLLNDATRGFLSADRIARMRRGAVLVNTARGGLVDEAAMIAALESGHLGHAALDVFEIEPLPAGHRLTQLENVTLSAHSGYRTPEATDTLLRRALDIAREVVAKAG